MARAGTLHDRDATTLREIHYLSTSECIAIEFVSLRDFNCLFVTLLKHQCLPLIDHTGQSTLGSLVSARSSGQ